jgi:peptidoglycan/LPS O-acetylase OafA/YrhL
MAEQKSKGEDGGNYIRFMAMIGTSTVVMFVLMYFNTYDADHIFWSETRFWMAFVMGAAMMVVMLLFMSGMYKSTAKNFIILGVAAVVFALALWLVRSQTTITDSEYMQAMIPHHSIAIMTSERAHIRDPRVRKLAHDIILAQRREIAQMKYLIADIEENGVRTTERLPEEAEQ